MKEFFENLFVKVVIFILGLIYIIWTELINVVSDLAFMASLIIDNEEIGIKIRVLRREALVIPFMIFGHDMYNFMKESVGI